MWFLRGKKPVHVVSVNLEKQERSRFLKGVVIICLLVLVNISMLFEYIMFVILVNQSFNQQINGSLSLMNDAQCYSIAYLGNFLH